MLLIDSEEVMESIRTLPNGTAAGMDGIPYELWKELIKIQNRNAKKELPFFNALQWLTKVFNSIEQTGVHPETKFNQG